MSTALRPRSTRLAAVAVLCFGALGARAADLPLVRDGLAAAHVSPLGGGGYWAPLVPLRPPPARFDIYGYPIIGPGLVEPPAAHAFGVGCPPALQPAYDPDGNLAGYAPVQYCR